MGCLPCQRARQRLKSQIRRGDVRGAINTVTLSARIMAMKASGLDPDDIAIRLGKELGLTEQETEDLRRRIRAQEEGR